MLIFFFFQYNYNRKKNVEVKKDENTVLYTVARNKYSKEKALHNLTCKLPPPSRPLFKAWNLQLTPSQSLNIDTKTLKDSVGRLYANTCIQFVSCSWNKDL